MRRDVQLSCELVTGGSDEPLDYAVGDLSVDGLWVPTSTPLRTGEVVVVCIAPRVRDHWGKLGDRMMHVFARVVRVQTPNSPSLHRDRSKVSPGMGLKMLDLTASERRDLGGWLSEQGTASLN